VVVTGVVQSGQAVEDLPKGARCTALKADGEACRAFASKKAHALTGRVVCTAHGGLAGWRSRDAIRARDVCSRNERAAKRPFETVIAEKLEQNGGAVAEGVLNIIEHGSDADALAALQLADRVLMRRPVT
jgi:hypothetical protein